MVATHGRLWLAISVVGWAACSSHASAPSRVASPVEPLSPVAAASVAAAPAAVAAVEPPTVAPVEPPTAASVVEPPPAIEPVVTSPPCPDDPMRDKHQKPDQVMQLLALSESMTVVDLGSGNGYFLCRLSRAVGPRGHVVATEVDNGLVSGLKKRVEREQLSNVEVVRAPTNDVGIAPGSADRILLVNVWHHLSDRKHYATRIARALSPGGRVVVVDFKPTRGSSHGITPERVLAELRGGGIDGSLVSEELPDQYVIVGSLRALASDARRSRLITP